MKHSINKTFLYVNKLGIKEVESTEVDVNNIINTMKLNKEKNEKRTLRRLKCEFKGKTIQKIGDCWIIS
ncbi:hypothetical protein [Robertmurraya sp.]|uniref:hypothetical protein n=1 Tax=Robertmurraya sp. TaxID=2837525 RepID=UPI003704B1FD